jgi:hypothetical protein
VPKPPLVCDIGDLYLVFMFSTKIIASSIQASRFHILRWRQSKTLGKSIVQRSLALAIRQRSPTVMTSSVLSLITLSAALSTRARSPLLANLVMDEVPPVQWSKKRSRPSCLVGVQEVEARSLSGLATASLSNELNVARSKEAFSGSKLMTKPLEGGSIGLNPKMLAVSLTRLSGKEIAAKPQPAWETISISLPGVTISRS